MYSYHIGPDLKNNWQCNAHIKTEMWRSCDSGVILKACISTTLHMADGDAQPLYWVPGDVAESGFVVLVVAPVRPRHLLQVQTPRHSLQKDPIASTYHQCEYSEYCMWWLMYTASGSEGSYILPAHTHLLSAPREKPEGHTAESSSKATHAHIHIHNDKRKGKVAL